MKNHKSNINHKTIMDKFMYTFPETPDSFKQSVYKTVTKNIIITEPISVNKKKIKNSRIYNKLWKLAKTAVAAVCILLIGGTACAFGLSKLNRHLDNHNLHQVPEESIITNIPSTFNDCLIIDDFYIDNNYLTFTAHLPENATIIPTDSRDHIYINGYDCLVENFVAGSSEPGSYFCLVNTSFTFTEPANQKPDNSTNIIDKLLLEDELTIEMELYMNGTNHTSTSTFKIKTDKIVNNTKKIPEQVITIADGINAYVLDSSISPSAISLKIQFEGENRKNILGKNFYIEDSDGNRTFLEDSAKNVLSTEMNDITEWTTQITNFNMNSDYIKFIPFSRDYDSTIGKEIYGTEKADEMIAFTIQLKE